MTLNDNNLVELLANSFLKDSKNFFNVQGGLYAHADSVTQIAKAENVYNGVVQREYVSAPAAFADAVKTLISDGTICQASDLCYLYKLDTEMCAVGFVSIPDFVKRVETLCVNCPNKEYFPKVGTFKGLVFGSNNYPNWAWSNFSPNLIPHIKAVCNAYIQCMSSKGFKHPTCD